MISLELATQLKEAGLLWQPALHDFFALPEHGMGERIFVISDIQASVDFLQGEQVVSFQGASEWALDYLLSAEALWVPSESQLRQRLESALLESGSTELSLHGWLAGYQLSMRYLGEVRSFQAAEADEAYAQALLIVLRSLTEGE